MQTELRFRQVHLDFHTSEHIPGIGSEFDPEKFVHTLKEAAVDSITCFSRCHHGYIYHDTKFPYRHPELTCNLLMEQVRACHSADIKVPVYITVGWDHLIGKLHPEWREVFADGKYSGRGPLENGWGWEKLDFASPYVDFLEEQTLEVCDMLGDELDGLFFDIIFQQGVHGKYSLDRFNQLGWDPTDVAKQEEMKQLLVNELTTRIYNSVRTKNKKCSIFFNGGHVGPEFRPRIGNYSHLEIESLPSGGWGYMHFPMTSRYSRTLGLDFLGMTGKFSESWGHFASYKNPSALEYECFSALAQGGKCSIGDQLHPSGLLDSATYELIGSVYRQIRDVEPWCRGARAVTEIAVLNAEGYGRVDERIDPRNLGIARMLIEGRHQFDFVDIEADLSIYKILILPDGIQLADTEKIEAFLKSGKSIIVAGSTLLDPNGNVWDVFNSAVTAAEGELPYSPDFLKVEGDTTDYVMYEKGLRLEATPGATVLASISEPYFNRAWNHFISHAHSPVARSTQGVGVVHGGNVIAFAHPIFTTYAKHSMSFHRDIFLKTLNRVLPEPLIQIEGPTSLQATITQQAEPNRTVIHLLHYVPERRGLRFDVIEDPMVILPSVLRVRGTFEKATLVPTKENLSIRQNGSYTEIDVPQLIGKGIVCLE
jgi:hypothetical protein